jgi:Fe-S-cluster containining protein
MADEFLCVRCARVQRTCCQTSEIYVSPGDVRRIAAFTGQTDFFEDRAAENPTYLPQDDDPAWRDNMFQADGKRRVIYKVADGSCQFLGAHGCQLPMETRPLVCRIYPYDYDDHGIKKDLSHGCPLHLVRPGQDLLTELNMHLTDAERWHQQLYDEIREEREFRMKGQSAVEVSEPTACATANVDAS